MKADLFNCTFIRGGNADIGLKTNNAMWSAYNKINAENKIYLPTHGTAELFINGTHYTMKKGKVYFIGENEARSYYLTDENSTFSKQLVHFYASYGHQSAKEAFDLPDEVWLDDDEFKQMYALLKKITVHDSTAPHEVSELFLNKSKVFDVVSYYVYLAKKKNLHRIAQRDEQSKINFMLMQCIEDSDVNYIDTKELAEKLSMNEKYFLRYFKANFGVTPRTLINKKKYAMAKGLLLYSNYSIADITQKCGFKHESYFCESFKQYFGMSPLKLRMYLNSWDQDEIKRFHFTRWSR